MNHAARAAAVLALLTGCSGVGVVDNVNQRDVVGDSLASGKTALSVSVTLADGTEYWGERAIPVQLTATGSPTQMCLSERRGCLRWVPFSAETVHSAR